MVYFRKLIRGVDSNAIAGPSELSTDNQAARDLSYNPENHQRTKHVERRHFFIRDMISLLIAHRGLCTRKRKPSEAGLTSCRICGKTDETVEHLGECEGLKEVYTSLRKLDEKGEWRQPKLNLLGVSEKDGGLHEPLERGISAVHTIVWREMIGEITRVDTDGRRFSAQATLRRAKRRCVERMHAFEQQVANYTLRKEAKGEDPTDGYEGYQKQVQGILTVGEEGEIVIEPNSENERMARVHRVYRRRRRVRETP